jgi:hypothetical protein
VEASSHSPVERDEPARDRALLSLKRRPYFKTHKRLEKQIYDHQSRRASTNKDCAAEAQLQFTGLDWGSVFMDAGGN